MKFKSHLVQLPSQAAAACFLGAGATRILHDMAQRIGFSKEQRNEIQKRLKEARAANFAKSSARPRFKRKATVDDELVASYDSLPEGI